MDDSGDQNRRSSPVDFAPRTATSYLDPHYWDERFATEEHYEWSKDYSHFQHLVLPFLDPSHSVLEIGCGNSRLCEELRKDGVADMTCVDISPVAVERMRSRFRDKGLEGIKVVQADMLDLSFGSEPFDIVIGKGTMGRRTMKSDESEDERSSVPSYQFIT
ncbi:EEF1A lysine methyltransferase 4-like [Zingiber officinale]|uniref:EEF1A lysine methyltransferase 4-like n=1 Tax=Zingiber officinale TaxID=94328 RepID=UPI001C4CB3B0|nr:EEF1A lysine methyltransferase 4-like [Zingiber officinale]